MYVKHWREPYLQTISFLPLWEQLHFVNVITYSITVASFQRCSGDSQVMNVRVSSQVRMHFKIRSLQLHIKSKSLTNFSSLSFLNCIQNVVNPLCTNFRIFQLICNYGLHTAMAYSNFVLICSTVHFSHL